MSYFYWRANVGSGSEESYTSTGRIEEVGTPDAKYFLAGINSAVLLLNHTEVGP